MGKQAEENTVPSQDEYIAPCGQIVTSVRGKTWRRDSGKPYARTCAFDRRFSEQLIRSKGPESVNPETSQRFVVAFPKLRFCSNALSRFAKTAISSLGVVGRLRRSTNVTYRCSISYFVKFWHTTTSAPGSTENEA